MKDKQFLFTDMCIQVVRVHSGGALFIFQGHRIYGPVDIQVPSHELPSNTLVYMSENCGYEHNRI